MTLRRGLLVAALAALVASAAHPAIGAPVDVEAGGYGGTASGGWACGPNARVKYGGVGGEVRVHGDATKEEPEHGFTASLGGAVEDREFTLLDCGDQCGSGQSTTIPRGGLVGAGAAKAGYDWGWFGFKAGLNAYELWSGHQDRSPSLMPLPALTLRGGPLTGLHFEAGLGSYDVPTMLRPGLWGGAIFVPGEGWEIAVHGGVHQTFDGSGGARGALALRLPVSDVVQLGAGIALSEGAGDRVEPEGQGSVIVHAW